MNYTNRFVLCSGDELSQLAYITFKDNQGAETAMLLTVFVLSRGSENLCLLVLDVLMIHWSHYHELQCAFVILF
jgi:hypothetical protein